MSFACACAIAASACDMVSGATWAPASGGRSRRMTKPSVVPCSNTVTRITAKAATSMKSRPGKSAGTLSATASVTTPRMPAQLSTVDARQPIVSKRRQPNCRRSAITPSQAKIHAKRASVIASSIQRMGTVMCSTTTTKPPARSMTSRSDEPMSMNTLASSRKISTVQNEVPRSRMAAENTTCWYQPQMRPATTVAMTPDTWSISAKM